MELERLRMRLAEREPTRVEVSGTSAIEAAVAVLLVPGREDLDLLLIRRAERQGDPWSGHMALPGGRREPADQDLSVTARRETREETAIELAPSALLGSLDDLNPTTTTLPPVVVRPYVFALAERPEVRPNAEVADWLWTPLRELELRRATTEVQVGGRPRQVSAFELGPHVVWGITLRILEPLLQLAR